MSGTEKKLLGINAADCFMGKIFFLILAVLGPSSKCKTRTKTDTVTFKTETKTKTVKILCRDTVLSLNISHTCSIKNSQERRATTTPV